MQRVFALLPALLISTACSQAPPDKPVKHRFYARDAQNRCTVAYEATGAGTDDSLILEVHANQDLRSREARPDIQGKVAFSATLTAGLVHYGFTLRAKKGAVIRQVERADSVACGDAYLIYGQSNAEALYGSHNYAYSSAWIRTYRGGWRIPDAEAIGIWGHHLARQIVEKQQVPVCIINGAIGNTSIAELSPGYVIPSDNGGWISATKPYGNFYKRLKGWTTEAGLAGQAKALIWHQGEKQVYGGDYNGYEAAFLKLRENFYQDFPGIQKLFMYQIKMGCGSGSIGWSIMFEAQRKLAADLPDVEIMSTLGPDILGCHYGEEDLTGYQTIGEWLYPMIDSAFYGGKYPHSLAPPNLLQAAYTNKDKNEIVLLFDQDVKWNDSLPFDPQNPAHVVYFGKEGKKATPYLKDIFAMDSALLKKVVSGRSEGTKIYLKLAGSSNFKKLAYPHGGLHGQYPGPFITGAKNGLGALGFFVPIANSLVVGLKHRETAPYTAGSRILKLPGSRASLDLPPDFGLGTENFYVEVRDARGQAGPGIQGRRLQAKGPLVLDFEALPAGLYFLTLKDRKRMLRFPIFLGWP